MLDAVDGSPVKTKKNVKDCTLDKPTQNLIQQIFNNDMFKEAMVKMDLGMLGFSMIVQHIFTYFSLQICDSKYETNYSRTDQVKFVEDSL